MSGSIGSGSIRAGPIPTYHRACGLSRPCLPRIGDVVRLSTRKGGFVDVRASHRCAGIAREDSAGGVESFNNSVLPAAKSVTGYRAAFLLVDRQTGKGMGITLWESENARRRGAEAVDEARAATIKAMGGTVPPVDEFEVVASDL